VLRTNNGILCREIDAFRAANEMLRGGIGQLNKSNCELWDRILGLQAQLESQKSVSRGP
jgi:hypothetical protein